MPVLNGMPYFPQALESVLHQTLHDIEVIIVDAGSNDGTLSYIEEQKKCDDRVHLIHSDKKSHGHQCNLGIAFASGEYIGFCESDDFIDSTMYEDLYQLGIDSPKANVITSNFYKTYGEGNEQKDYITPMLSRKNTSQYGEYVTFEQVSEVQHNLIYMWHSIYSKSFLSANAIKLNDSAGAAFQDIGFIEQVKLYSEYLIFTFKAYYHYRQDNPQSSFHKKELGLNGIQELDYGLDTYLRNISILTTRKYIIFERLFSILIYHLRRDQRYCPEVTYQKAADAVQKKVQPFFASLPFYLQANCDDRHLELYLSNHCLFQQILSEEARIEDVKLKQLLNKIQLEKQIILYGYGIRGKEFHSLLQEKSKNICILFCDSNEDLWDDLVKNPLNIIENHKNDIYLITVEAAFKEIHTQLVENGIPVENIWKIP